MPQPTITHTVNVYRFGRTGSKDAYAATPVLTGLDVSVMPAGPETAAIYGGMNAFALFEIYTTEFADIRNGDKLTAGSRSWIVKDQPQQIENRYLSYVRMIGEEAL